MSLTQAIHDALLADPAIALLPILTAMGLVVLGNWLWEGITGQTDTNHQRSWVGHSMDGYRQEKPVGRRPRIEMLPLSRWSCSTFWSVCW